MKTKISKAIAFMMMSMILSGVVFSTPARALPPQGAQSDENTPGYNTYHGRLMDKSTNDRISYASIFVQGQNVSTISNDQGEFVLKVAQNSGAKNIVISHLGYKSLIVPLSELTHRVNRLYMEPVSIALSQIYIRPGPVEQIIRKVIENKDKNYSIKANKMTGFYRESIMKRRSYVSLAEAVVDIYKAPYRGLSDDQVRVVIGRMGNNVKKMDTLLFKLEGGPTTSLLLDIVKNPYILLNSDMIYKYRFSLENEVKIDKHVFYVIAFSPISKDGVPQYSGRFYVEVGSYALAYAQFRLDLSDPEEAASLFIQKKPAGAKVTPLSADYIVKYKELNGKWYFNYSKGEASFKVKWKKKLFASTYTTTFELAVTNRSDQDVVKFKPRDRFKPREIFSESLQAFSNENYWGKYNIIKPNQSIEAAIRKFERIIKRSERK